MISLTSSSLVLLQILLDRQQQHHKSPKRQRDRHIVNHRDPEIGAGQRDETFGVGADELHDKDQDGQDGFEEDELEDEATDEEEGGRV